MRPIYSHVSGRAAALFTGFILLAAHPALAGHHEKASGMTAAGPLAGLTAGDYQVEPKHAYITFSYSHKGYSNPFLRFRSFSGSVAVDPAHPERTSVTIDIDPNSIDSGVDEFDDHLRGEKLFDVENHPGITFRSTSLKLDEDGSGKLTGDLTIKGITRPVMLDIKMNKIGKDRSGEAMFGISGRTRILRSDWDLGYAAPVVGDEVDLIVEVEFVKGG